MFLICANYMDNAIHPGGGAAGGWGDPRQGGQRGRHRRVLGEGVGQPHLCQPARRGCREGRREEEEEDGGVNPSESQRGEKRRYLNNEQRRRH